MKKIIVNEEMLSEDKLKDFNIDYFNETQNVVLRHALSRGEMLDIINDSKNNSETRFKFSIDIPTLPITNQHASGRCWIFAGLNVLREKIAKQLNLKEFELSQNYVALYDKLEKANYLITSIIDLIDSKSDDRVLMHLLSNGVGDGGQWDMFRNLVVKYGICPKDVFGETYQSSNTRKSDELLNSYIRQFACNAQKLYKDKKYKEINELKNETMSNIYALLINCFGIPPKEFNFEYVDKDNNYHLEKGYTPKSFFDKYIGETIDEYVSLINSPTKDKPFNKSYTVDYLGNVLEGKIVRHLNVTMSRMKEIIINQLKDQEIVWFGSDVASYGDRKLGIWDDNKFDYMSAFNFEVKFNKADMLDYRQSSMSHAMCIVGVNLVDEVPTKWKIENSWGEQSGHKGYYVMSSSWFDTYVYQAVVLKKYLTSEELEAYNSDPIVLDPWDPMGTLAE